MQVKSLCLVFSYLGCSGVGGLSKIFFVYANKYIYYLEILMLKSSGTNNNIFIPPKMEIGVSVLNSLSQPYCGKQVLLLVRIDQPVPSGL